MVAANRRLESSSGWIARWAWGLAGLVVVVQTTAHLVNELVLGDRYPQLRAAVDGNAFGRANTLAIALSALLTAFAALRRPGARLRLLALSASLALLAVDDATGLHDRIRALPRPRETAVALGLASLLILVFLLLSAEARLMRFRERRLLIAGLLALVAGVAVRIIGAFVTLEATLGDTLKAVGVAVEQDLDLGGWILVATGLAAALRARAQPSSPPPH